MYDTILVPTDGSDTAEYAVEHAIDLAEKYDADVHALYVVDTSAIDVSLGTEQVDRIRQGKFGDMPELEQRANEATGVVAAKAEAHDISVTEAVVAGQPHKQISSYAADNDVDLIVMGSAGRSGVRRALLGSVAERTLRSTKIPVLVVDRED
ncbi:universal stress protein [Natronococcus sp. A-GB7]|uniref:universal stress protein n=1 Tax=Natronococcus sp. A-GB7 TaxID=3037649 RepID=UPI00241DAE0A|nr:universal stress protein [Natronococcus sp. A-GB7]MDG5820337.1 universal stress protein [Natronococcus sp. A-GB7]